MPIIDIIELQGHVFRRETDDGQRHQVWIDNAIGDHEEEVYCHPKHIRLKCSTIRNECG